MSMTNKEIITLEASLISFDYTGENLFTFMQWNIMGYKIIKGSKAIINTMLWKKVTQTNKETKQKTEKFILCKSSLFSSSQVEKELKIAV